MKIKIVRLLIVLAGIAVGQFILYGPSLVGKKVLLPLNILTTAQVYLPLTTAISPAAPQNIALCDLVFQSEPMRLFAISELRAGRLPMWNPYQYAGAPVAWPKFSPFLLLECCTSSPIILAWTQFLTAIIAGLGIYLFLRRTLAVEFWAAAIPAWCYPLTGFFILWAGYAAVFPICLFPWLLLAVAGTVRRTNKFAPIGLSVITGVMLVSGNSDIAGQALLMSGLYAIWCIGDTYRREWFRKPAQKVIATLAVGWILGFLVATPYLLPLVEYMHTGARMEQRSSGYEERPPVGLAALPQAILPDIYGSDRKDSLRLVSGSQNESSASAYAGLIATLLLAPLAFCSRRHRSSVVFFSLLAFFGLSWCLDVPGIVQFLRLPGLNMMSHNRLTFATALAILVLVSVGIDALWRGNIRRRWWFLAPMGLLALLLAWNFFRVMCLPEPLRSQLERTIQQGQPYVWIQSFDDVREAQSWFISSYKTEVTLCSAALIGWLLIMLRPKWPKWSIPVLGLVLTADLIRFGVVHTVQCDPTLYYPRIPALEAVAKSAPGRIVGFACLPAALAQTQGLRDIRGYDAIDPARLMDLMKLAANARFQPLPYALTEWFYPRSTFLPPDGMYLPPILDLLNVRYIIFRDETPPPPSIQPVFRSPDYWVLVNHSALPRAFVPQHVELVTNANERLQKMASPIFNPREVAYVETPVNLPDTCEGTAEITGEISTRVSISTQMKTPGLVVLADLWDKGWNAYLNGQRVPILRADHAVRGVIVPAGTSVLEFRYEPASFRHGLQLAGFAAAALLIWLGVIFYVRNQKEKNEND